ncbi:putative F-box/kelch-repeat protein At3g17570 [Dioscorea cayenensis subsp. rotundata]|uniref:F-box/kelch-repeat protein At3g17570 n=1 Tax=Dioscorea cayennensis subsp. rotundata TaxID=55577 RepID=A0AB40C4K5_DIOCR|nr:putative F-box/kelch-repeat protein At3g17570 [Dioscorea cayenensis subsp. rotundata]
MLADNLDLLLEVLSLLPTRSLIRFKSVCKRWHLVISDPYFIKIHTNRCNPYAMSGFRFSNQEVDRCYLLGGAHASASASAPDLFSLSILKDDAESLKVVGNYRLYCCRSFYALLICPLMLSRSELVYEFIYIFNPVTKQFKRIPYVDPERYFSDIILTPDHKVIMFSTHFIHYYDADIRMYIPDTQSWKTLYSFGYHKKSRNFESIFIQRKGIFLNGTVYQVMEYETIPETTLKFPFCRKLYIFSFNLESLSAQKLLLPLDFYQENLYFGEIQGHLHLIMQQSIFDFVFHIMEIKEDFSGWNFLHCIGLSPIHVALGEREEDYELFLTLVIPRYWPAYTCGLTKIFSYNIVSNTYREIQEVSNEEEGRYGGYYGAFRIKTYYPMLTTP